MLKGSQLNSIQNKYLQNLWAILKMVAQPLVVIGTYANVQPLLESSILAIGLFQLSLNTYGAVVVK